jgi:hypothetical protein
MKQFWFIFIFGLLIFVDQILARDTIVLLNGKEIDAVVSKETAEFIEFKDAATGASQKKDVDDVMWVNYEDAPRDYSNGIEAIRGAKYKEAAAYFIKAQKETTKTKNDWHVDYFEYYLAYSLFMARDENPKYVVLAQKKFVDFNKSRTNSRFALPSLYFAGECELFNKNYAAARSIFEMVGKSKRTVWTSKASAGMARSYMAESNMDEALKVCVGEIQGGSLSSEVVVVMTEILIDKQKNYELAYNLGSKLVCRGDVAFKNSVHELRGCAAFGLKKYEESLDDLLRCALLYSSEQEVGGRVNIYLAGTIKALLNSKSPNYPEWQYQQKFVECYRKMTVADQKVFKTFKL